MSAWLHPLTNMPLWWGMLTMGEATHVGTRQIWQISVPSSFALNLKLLKIQSILRERERDEDRNVVWQSIDRLLHREMKDG